MGLTRRSRGRGNSQDAGSRWVLWIGITAAVLLALELRAVFPEAAFPHSRAVANIGFGIFALGVIIRWWAIIHLGRFFTIDVSIASDHRVIDSGPYRYVRHPSYTGALLAFVGFGLTLGNWASFFALVTTVVLVFLHRIRVEERALAAALPAEYPGYMQRTSRLVPGLY